MTSYANPFNQNFGVNKRLNYDLANVFNFRGDFGGGGSGPSFWDHVNSTGQADAARSYIDNYQGSHTDMNQHPNSLAPVPTFDFESAIQPFLKTIEDLKGQYATFSKEKQAQIDSLNRDIARQREGVGTVFDPARYAGLLGARYTNAGKKKKSINSTIAAPGVAAGLSF